MRPVLRELSNKLKSREAQCLSFGASERAEYWFRAGFWLNFIRCYLVAVRPPNSAEAKAELRKVARKYANMAEQMAKGIVYLSTLCEPIPMDMIDTEAVLRNIAARSGDARPYDSPTFLHTHNISAIDYLHELSALIKSHGVSMPREGAPLSQFVRTYATMSDGKEWMLSVESLVRIAKCVAPNLRDYESSVRKALNLKRSTKTSRKTKSQKNA